MLLEKIGLVEKSRIPRQYLITNLDGLAKSLLGRHPGESRGPELLEITGFRLSPE
jgi:hypothetical protein